VRWRTRHGDVGRPPLAFGHDSSTDLDASRSNVRTRKAEETRASDGTLRLDVVDADPVPERLSVVQPTSPTPCFKALKRISHHRRSHARQKLMKKFGRVVPGFDAGRQPVTSSSNPMDDKRRGWCCSDRRPQTHGTCDGLKWSFGFARKGGLISAFEYVQHGYLAGKARSPAHRRRGARD